MAKSPAGVLLDLLHHAIMSSVSGHVVLDPRQCFQPVTSTWLEQITTSSPTWLVSVRLSPGSASTGGRPPKIWVCLTAQGYLGWTGEHPMPRHTLEYDPRVYALEWPSVPYLPHSCRRVVMTCPEEGKANKWTNHTNKQKSPK